NALRERDCNPASSTDRRSQQRISDRLRSPGGAGRIAVLELVGAELGDVFGKLRVVLAEFVELLAVMAVDFGLDRVGAGKGGFLGDERGRSAEREAGPVPDRLERGRTHAALGHQGVEPGGVPLLLRRHAGDELGLGAVRTKHCELAGVDPRRTIFAGLIDAQHRGAVRAAIARTPAGHRASPWSEKRRISAAPPSDMMAFQPASEKPRNDHWTWSQRISGAPVIWRNTSAVEPLWGVEVHVVKPSKILSSTPA